MLAQQVGVSACGAEFADPPAQAAGTRAAGSRVAVPEALEEPSHEAHRPSARLCSVCRLSSRPTLAHGRAFAVGGASGWSERRPESPLLLPPAAREAAELHRDVQSYSQAGRSYLPARRR